MYSKNGGYREQDIMRSPDYDYDKNGDYDDNDDEYVD